MPDSQEPNPPEIPKPKSHPRRRSLHDWWLEQTRRGLRTPLMRFAGHLGLLTVIALGVWATRFGFDSLPVAASLPLVAEQAADPAAPTEMPIEEIRLEDLPVYAGAALAPEGILRGVDVHTVIPSRPRMEVSLYQVRRGDTLFGIAEQFGLRPETILWGNFELLQDNPHNLTPGQELNILPVDGTYYQWHEGDGLSGVADFFGVESQVIVDWPGNDLDPLTDPASPGIEAGAWLVIPGGEREFQSWRAPSATRAEPAVASVSGPGACGAIYDGPIGTSSFAWPTPGRSISGYTFSGYHPGVDIGGSIGNAIFAADSGVVVYAGWNYFGYGNLIIIDHGTGWQTLYAHLSSLNVGCGQAVFQGNVIGGMGCTGNCSGPHLHFEMNSELYGRVNPLLYLP